MNPNFKKDIDEAKKIEDPKKRSELLYSIAIEMLDSGHHNEAIGL